MKRFRGVYLLIGVLSLLPIELLADSAYTSVAIDNEKRVYVGMKNEQPGMEMQSSLSEISIANFRTRKIQLPRDLARREIIAIFPVGHSVLVLTQWTIEQGDNPILHVFDRIKKTWKKIGVAGCPSFDKIRVDQEQLVFHCEEDTPEGKIRFTEKSLKFGKFVASVPPAISGEIKLPQAKVSIGKVTAALEGDVYHWDKLHIWRDGKDRVIVVTDLLSLLGMR